MSGNANRILTTHVGSLIRPPKLIEFWRAIEDGKPYDEAAFETCLTECVAEVVRQQAETGIDIVSDGEFSKGPTGHFIFSSGSLALPCAPPPPEEAKTRWPRWRGPGPRGISGILCRVRHRNRSRQTARQSRRRQRPDQIFGRQQVVRDITNIKAGVAKAKQQYPALAAIPARGRAGKRAAGRQDRALQGRGGLSVSRSPTRYTRNTRPSSTPAFMCRSTMRSCPTCTSAWCRR